MTSVGWVDWALLGVLAASALVGLWRGVVYEVLALLGWVVAYVAAQALAPEVAPQLSIGRPDSALRIGAAFALVFVATLVLWSLAAWLVRRLVRATPLTLPDHLLGAVFGVLRGVVLLLVVVTLVAFTPARDAAAWKRSRGAAWLGTVLQELKPLLPAGVARYLPE